MTPSKFFIDNISIKNFDGVIITCSFKLLAFYSLIWYKNRKTIRNGVKILLLWALVIFSFYFYTTTYSFCCNYTCIDSLVLLMLSWCYPSVWSQLWFVSSMIPFSSVAEGWLVIMKLCWLLHGVLDLIAQSGSRKG